MTDQRAELQDVADLMAERHAELTGMLVQRFRERIPELPGDAALVDLLRSSAGSNLQMLGHLLRGHVPEDRVPAPAAAVEYARRLAQRGTPPSALLRAYRLGQQIILRWAGDQIAQRVGDPDLAYQTIQSLTDISFHYIDSVSEDVIGAYQDERDSWLAHRSAVQRETIDALLRGDRLDLAAAEAALGHRLRQRHLGLVLWTTGAAELADSERLLDQLAARVGSGRPLFVPRDRETAWGWLPLAGNEEVDVAAIEAVLAQDDAGVRVALGSPETGESGFRDTHVGAAAAHRVAEIGQSGQRVISYADPTVRAAALLAGDLATTRRMVARTLGELAAGGKAAARMRATLLAFLQERESYVATGARLHLHKNTVKYRVDRALEVRGRPLADERLDLELALIACHWLAPEVLLPAGG